MPTDDLARYKPLFLQTAWDYLRQLEGGLQILSSEPSNKEAINAVHLSAHSLKSQSAVMNFPQLAAVCHQIEKDFRMIKDGGNEVNSDEIQKLLKVVSGIKESLAQITTENTEKPMADERYLLGMADEGENAA